MLLAAALSRRSGKIRSSGHAITRVTGTMMMLSRGNTIGEATMSSTATAITCPIGLVNSDPDIARHPQMNPVKTAICDPTPISPNAIALASDLTTVVFDKRADEPGRRNEDDFAHRGPPGPHRTIEHVAAQILRDLRDAGEHVGESCADREVCHTARLRQNKDGRHSRRPLQIGCVLPARFGSSGWTRTSNPPVNSRMLCH
jgi:hypothetical protein